MKSFLFPSAGLLAGALAVFLPPALAIPLLPAPAGAGIPDGAAMVVGFHVLPAGDDGVLPWPESPDELEPHAVVPGVYDVWLFLHTRAPLIGAWTISFALDYDGRPGQGVDVLQWEQFTDEFRASPGWPAAGEGARVEWWRVRCWEPERYMRRGTDGWWVQPILKLVVQVHGDDRIGLGDPEPAVPPQIIECADEYHPLDGTDSWVRVIPALFGAPRPESPAGDIRLPVGPASWSWLKTLYDAAPAPPCPVTAPR